MRIRKAELYHVKLPMKFKFRTAQTTIGTRETLIIKLTDTNGDVGYGETVSFTESFYTDETLGMSKDILIREYLPGLFRHEIAHPYDVHKWFGSRYPMAAAGVENALMVIDAYQNNQNIIQRAFPDTTPGNVKLGIVLGDLPIEALRTKVLQGRERGCRRFKIKIKPSDGYEKLGRLTAAFPELSFTADANRSFSLDQFEQLKMYESLNLRCIEEPFQFTDFAEVKDLQKHLNTPVCLDESIQTLAELEKAVHLHVFQVLNIKIGKAGGLYYVRQITDFCRQHQIDYWIGSMVESGISKILHIGLAGALQTYMPGDLSDSDRYFVNDLIKPEIAFIDGVMQSSKRPGLGVDVDEDQLNKATIDKITFNNDEVEETI